MTQFIDKISKLYLNNQSKKLTLIVTVFFAFLAQSDLSVMTFKIPDFSKLSVIEGKIVIDQPKLRIGRQFNLVVEGKKLPFNCSILRRNNRSCIDFERLSEVQNQIGKVWFYKGNDLGLGKDVMLYQLEVNGRMVIKYEEQANLYLAKKDNHPYVLTAFFILSLVFFFILQLQNSSPIIEKQENK